MSPSLLVISAAFPPMASGEAANTFQLCRRLVARGVRIRLLTSAEREIERPEWLTLDPIMPDWSWRRLAILVRHTRRVRPDAVLLIYLGGIYDYHPMITFAPTLLKRTIPGLRVVTRFENPLSAALPQSWGFGTRLVRRAVAWRCGRERVDYGFGTLVRDSDRMLVLCDYHARLLSQVDPRAAAKTTIVPPPSNFTVVPDPDGRLRAAGRARLDVPEDAFLLGYLGYVYPDKGVEILLQALACLRAEGRRVALVVLGGKVQGAGIDSSSAKYFDQMQALGRELGLESAITWAGAFSAIDRGVAECVRGVDAFVLPFDNGIALNNSSFTTLACYGVPVVTTVTGNTDAEFQDGENVLLCPPKDPQAVVEAVRRLMDDAGLGEHLRRGSLALAERSFSWERALDRTLEALGLTEALGAVQAFNCSDE